MTLSLLIRLKIQALKKKVLFALYQKRQSTMDIIEELLKDIDLGENK